MDDRYDKQKYTIRKKIFKMFGAAFHICDMEGNVMFYVNQKGFKLKEDIRVYAREDMQLELLTIGARTIIDISTMYDITDAQTGERIGALKRKGLKSMIQDEWAILDLNDQEVGMIKEDSALLAMVRRFLSNLVPQKFHATMGGKEVWSFQQHFNPFVQKIDLDMSLDTEDVMDNRLGVAAAVLLCAIEGRQG